jgi:predicted nucleic acid-binding OB-fold protein
MTKRRANPSGETGWRSYGPGKYDSIVDSYVHALDSEGWGDEEIGDVQDFGWYGLMGPAEAGFLLEPDAVPRIAREEKDELTLEERKELRDVIGVIIEENDQGFVGVTYFTSKTKLKKAWEKLAADAEEFYQEQEEAEAEEGA